MTQEFIERKYLLNMGSGKLSRTYNLDREIVKEARKRARGLIKAETKSKFPKILVFDIETSPLEAYVWQKQVWKASVSDDHLISNWFMISWSAKWLFDDNVQGAVLAPEEILAENDKSIVEELWALFDDADIIIAHNGGNFDVPNMNTRFIVNDLPPPSSYQMIDTLKVARKEFGFTHNTLNALARTFGINEKIETSFSLWKDCKAGNPIALNKMLKYNKRDVEILEMIYLKLRPWIKSHPNVGLFLEEDAHVCPSCGGEVKNNGKYYYTMTGKYQTYECTKCGAISRGRKSIYTKEKRNSLLASVAR